MAEIERKFLPKTLPDLSKIAPVSYERYILFSQNGVELRIQKIDNIFQLERKTETGKLSREETIIEITNQEFELLKKLSNKCIIRESYVIQNSPEISIKIYHGNYEGLIRIEVEFSSEEEAQKFEPPDWFGLEITDSPLGRDGRLINLSSEEFAKLLQKI